MFCKKKIPWMKGACFEVFVWGQLVICGRTQQRGNREQYCREEPFAGPGSRHRMITVCGCLSSLNWASHRRGACRITSQQLVRGEPGPADPWECTKPSILQGQVSQILEARKKVLGEYSSGLGWFLIRLCLWGPTPSSSIIPGSNLSLSLLLDSENLCC